MHRVVLVVMAGHGGIWPALACMRSYTGSHAIRRMRPHIPPLALTILIVVGTGDEEAYLRPMSPGINERGQRISKSSRGLAPSPMAPCHLTQSRNSMRWTHTPRCAGELAFDQGAGGVRAAAVRATAVLVPNPLAAPLLRALLPGLAPLLWDRALGVRVAMADLLLAVGCASAESTVCWHVAYMCAAAAPAAAVAGQCPCTPSQAISVVLSRQDSFLVCPVACSQPDFAVSHHAAAHLLCGDC